MIKIEIKSIFGKVLFTHESETATVKKAVEEAVKNSANLSGAYLSGANLSGANLSGANLSMVTKLPLFCKWTFGITDGLIQIGCEKRSLSDWKTFLQSDEVISTPRDSEDFKQIVKVIKAMIAYLEG